MSKQVDELMALALSLKDPCCDTETTMRKLKASLEAALKDCRNSALEEATEKCDAAAKPEKDHLAQNEEQWAAAALASRIRSLKS